MARPDDTLRRIAQERLHAVARPGPGALDPAPWAPVPAPDGDAARDADASRDADVARIADAARDADATPDPETEWDADTARKVDGAPTRPPQGAAPPDASWITSPGPHRPLADDHPARPVRGRHRDASAPADMGLPDPAPVGRPLEVRRPGQDREPTPAPPRTRAVPAPGAGPVPDWPPVTGGGDDVRDVVERMRREALAEAADGYSARHGHPLDHPSMDAAAPGRRWFLTVRHAVVAGTAVALLTAGVVVRATADVPPAVDPPGEAVPVTSTPGPAGAAGPASPSGAAPAPPGAGPATGAGGADTAGTPGAVPSGDGATGPPAAHDPSGAVVVVHVVGQVHSPGVVRLPAGSRVADALRSAGGAGPAADLAGVNLARVLQDGEQIVVPAPGETVVPAPAGGGPSAAVDGAPAVVDLNTADLADLDALPGIGPVLAQRIVDWRAESGPFRDVEELGEVTGIGDALLGRLRPLVGV